jgi:hypothetical protein
MTQPTKNKRVFFTPWKAGTCLLAVGFMIGTFALLDSVIPGDAENATTQPVAGGTEFTIKSSKTAWLEMALPFIIFGCPALIFWWFWDRLSEEYYRSHERPDKDSSKRPFWRIVGYGLLALPGAIIVIAIVNYSILYPLTGVHRVTIRGGNVQIESLYRRWDISRADIRDVDVTREVDDGRGGPRAEYRMTIQLRDQRQFRTPGELQVRPPGGNEDRRYEKFFASLRDALTRKP